MELSEICPNLANYNSASTQVPYADSISDFKVNKVFKTKIEDNEIVFEKCNLQKDIASSFKTEQNYPTKIRNDDNIDIFDENEAQECPIQKLKNSETAIHHQKSKSISTTCTQKASFSVSTRPSIQLNSSFIPTSSENLSKPQNTTHNYCNQTTSFTVSPCSKALPKTPLHNSQPKLRRDRATRSKNRSLKRQEAASVQKLPRISQKSCRKTLCTQKHKKSQEQRNPTLRNPSGENFRTELKKLSKSWLKEKVSIKPKHYNAHKSLLGPSTTKKNMKHLSKLSNAHKDIKKATQKADFLSRNRKLMSVVKAHRDAQHAKSQSKPLRGMRQEMRKSPSHSPDIRTSLKMKNLLHKFRSTKI
ncbi:unnamed protein product [Moneuplotes crassus]|uniref:Uncharacterized protein n=1 Tax=Euplotes crassus TaxID=5936 RepID=A0AAD1XE85_EUPCR|nr:unnamed protein product [Moneuplotes crassus]